MSRRNSSDDELRSYERRETTDPVASRKARELRIRLGRPRPSDLILEQLPEEARLAFDRDEDWSDRIYLPRPSFDPGQPSEIEVILEPEGPDSPPEFYRRYYEEAYEVESSRWSYKGRPAVIAETHVFNESNGIWEGLGSDERRDVDELSVEDLYGPAPSGHARSPNTRWLDRRMWMQSWEPYDEHVFDTGEDPIDAYGLPDLPDDPRGGAEFRRADRRRLARCRFRALMWSFTTPEEYFALVGEAGLRWCSERSGQWHHHNPADEDLRRLERRSRQGDTSAKKRLAVEKKRRGLTDPMPDFAWAEGELDRVASGFENPDNSRIARANNEDELLTFESSREKGCCGSHEWEATDPEGTVWVLGFNYGH
jgi:hypothetical protein